MDWTPGTLADGKPHHDCAIDGETVGRVVVQTHPKATHRFIWARWDRWVEGAFIPHRIGVASDLDAAKAALVEAIA